MTEPIKKELLNYDERTILKNHLDDLKRSIRTTEIYIIEKLLAYLKIELN